MSKDRSCPTCGAEKGKPCVTVIGKKEMVFFHTRRKPYDSSKRKYVELTEQRIRRRYGKS